MSCMRDMKTPLSTEARKWNHKCFKMSGGKKRRGDAIDSIYGEKALNTKKTVYKKQNKGDHLYFEN